MGILEVCTIYIVYSLQDDFGTWRYLLDTVYDNSYEAKKHARSLGYNDRGKPVAFVDTETVYRFLEEDRT